MDFKLLEAGDYYQALLTQLPKAKKRIVLAAMVVLWGERTAPIFTMLQDAVARGVQVTVMLDSFTRLTSLLGLKSDSSGAERLRQTFRTLESLNAKGAKVYKIGKIGFPPQKGRCHIKVTVIDNTSYSFGGINFYDEKFEVVDYMLMNNSPEVADYLAGLVERISGGNLPFRDDELQISKNASILFDGGQPKGSLIYERACELAARARRIYYFSQMTPSGPLAKLLHETDSRIYTNRPERMLPIDGIAQAYDLQKYRIANLYEGAGYIHAKYILFELPGGRKALLSGSHNFSYRGVSFGTQEIALQSTDPALWQTLYDHIQRSIAQKTVK